MAIFGFLGAGNMGGALMRGALAADAAKAQDIRVYDASPGKAEAFCADTGAMPMGGIAELVAACDVTVLAMKPADAPDALKEIGAALTALEEGQRNRKLLLSIVLGLPIKAMRAATGGLAQYARAMPNAPALVMEGMSCVAFGKGISEENIGHAMRLLSAVGQVQELPERQLIDITALTGSSPAYVFVMLEAMADAAVHDGIPRDMAYRLAAQAVLGSAKMARDTRRHPAELKDSVCSPGGSTMAAIRSLEADGFRGSLIEAMIECNDRAREIAGE